MCGSKFIAPLLLLFLVEDVYDAEQAMQDRMELDENKNGNMYTRYRCSKVETTNVPIPKSITWRSDDMPFPNKYSKSKSFYILVMDTSGFNDSKKYYIGDYFTANFFEAYQFCLGHNQTLLSIQSKDEQEDIAALLENREGNFWTAGTDLGKEGNWIWMTVNRQFTYMNWKEGEPNNLGKDIGGENCLHIAYEQNEWKWNDAPCESKFFFICESNLSK